MSTNSPDDEQLRRLVDAGVDGWTARQAGDEPGLRQARARFEAIWRNSTPAVIARFSELTDRMNRENRGGQGNRGRRS